MGFDPDDSQADVIMRGPEERVLVTAGPGSGKTFTLVKRVARLVASGIRPSEMLVMSFTRAAVTEVAGRIRGDCEGVSEEDTARMVRTFDSWATALLRDDGGYGADVLDEMDYTDRIEAATALVGSRPEVIAGVRHLVVDEVQDLVGVRADLVLALIRSLPATCGVTLLGDPCQALYDYQVDGEAGEMDSDGFRASEEVSGFEALALAGEHRSGGSRPAWFSDDLASMRESILASDRRMSGLRTSSTLEDMVERACAAPWDVTDDLAEHPGPYSVGVLVRTNREAVDVAGMIGVYLMVSYRGGDDVPCRVVTHGPYSDEEGPDEVGPAGRGITVITVHASKGRQYDSVYIAPKTTDWFLDCLFLAGRDSLAEARAAYVALTRSKGQTRALSFGA